MPRVTKPKSGAVVKKPIAKIKNNKYAMPEPIPLGEILTDLSKKQWKIGPSIGRGGFGEIYSACKADGAKTKNDYDHVVKIEPHGNGPLFVEMHFYMRNAKLEDIKSFCSKHAMKTIGMPYFVGSGSHDLNGQKHRFLVMPRYGKDVWSFFLLNNKRLPQHTIYRLALQMLDIYEYIHGCTYVHGDLKGANILLGMGKNGTSQAYLVDYGLASHYTTKDYKPDSKKMHNGTIEYTSRDAHHGVPTMRGDFEILGYNLIHWSGVQLPWEKEKLLSNPVKVQRSKENFMETIKKSLDELFTSDETPIAIKDFMIYVQNLEYNEQPNYEKCRKIFLNGLKSLNKSNVGELELKLTKTPTLAQLKVTSKISDDFEDQPSPKGRRRKSSNSPINKKSPIKRLRNGSSNETPQSTKRSGRMAATPDVSLEFSPVVSINRNSVPDKFCTTKPGKTIINDNLTPTANPNKTYEINFEVDVSMDANIVVNVNRKKKAKGKHLDEKTETKSPQGSPKSSLARVSLRRLPVSNEKKTTRVNLRRKN